MARRLCLVGAGKMGGALLRGWLAQGLAAEQIIVIESDEALARAHAERLGVRLADGPAGLAPDAFDAVVFAVKPQALDAVAPLYARFTSAVFLSIAAGRTLASLAKHLGPDAAIVRAMPNTPAAVGRGIAVVCANAQVDAAKRDLCDGLLAAVGRVEWIDEESLLDAVTAISGSGPAYVFHFIECLAAAGAALGLPQDLALRLARETVCGAGALASQSRDSVETLRRNVTSPGGTTEAALAVLMAEGGLEALIARAAAAACRRSRELAGSNPV